MFEYQKRNMILLKTLVYFCCVCYAEFVVADHFARNGNPIEIAKFGKKDDQGRTYVENTRVSCLLLYEVIFFFTSILGMIFFLIFSRVFSFRTIRERAGYGAYQKKNMDFLEFVSEDIHWVLITFSQCWLFLFSIWRR